MNSKSYYPDLEIDKAIDRLETERAHEAATVIMSRFVKCLRSGEPIPSNLADFMADAFDVALHKETGSQRSTALARELGFEAQNRRNKASTIEVGEFLGDLLEPWGVWEDGVNVKPPIPTKNKAYELAAEHFYCTERTIEKHWKKYQEHKNKEHQEAALDAARHANE